MDTLLHIGGTLITIIFLGAVLYSLTSTFRKRRKAARRDKELAAKQHKKITNLHQYDVEPQHGYYKFPLHESGQLRRMPQKFTALSIVLANKQPYSICLIGFADFEKGRLTDSHYFYIQPPENDLSSLKNSELTWNLLQKADTFGEYWEAGMKDYFTSRTLVAHQAPFVIGCIAHALQIHGIEIPPMHYIDTLEIAKKEYSFTSNRLPGICAETGIELEEENALSEAIAAGRFLIQAGKDYPMHLPSIHYIFGTPKAEEKWAAAISAVEREAYTAEEIFAPNPPDMEMLQLLLDKEYIEPGEKEKTYYATNDGLDFAESQ